MLSKLFLSFVVSAVALVAQPAAAVVMTATFTGTIRGTSGLSEDLDLVGKGFTSVLTFDPYVGSVIYGGVGFDGRSGHNITDDTPFLSMTFHVDGTNQFDLSYAPNSLSQVVNYASSFNGWFGAQGFYVAEAGHAIVDNDHGYYFAAGLSLQTYAPTGDHLTDTFAGPVSRGQYGNTLNVVQDIAWHRVVNYTLALDPTYLSVTSSAVPEPASWALLLTGFGLTGAAMRRRRTALPSAA